MAANLQILVQRATDLPDFGKNGPVSQDGLRAAVILAED
jgi:hypothetical protein